MASTDAREHLVAALLRRAGRRYAEDAGIRLGNKPAPLYRVDAPVQAA